MFSQVRLLHSWAGRQANWVFVELWCLMMTEPNLSYRQQGADYSTTVPGIESYSFQQKWALLLVFAERSVPLIPIPVMSRGNRSTSFVSKSQFFSPPKQQTRIFLPRVRGMSDKLVDKTVVLTEWTKTSWSFMNPTYPWILKQRFPTFGTVISVADNDQDDAEMDYK